MKNFELQSDEFLIVPIELETMILTANLNKEVVLTLYSPRLGKACVCRNVKTEKMTSVFKEFMGDAKIAGVDYPRLIKVKLAGGNDSKEPEIYVQNLLIELMKIDNGTDALDIIAFDVCTRVHPNSIIFDCGTGEMREAKNTNLKLD